MDLLDRLAVTIGATRPDDRDALVRGDLLDTATRAGLRCAALLIQIATTPAQWEAIAADFRSAGMRWGSHVPGLSDAHDAAEALARGCLDRALAHLAASCGMSPEEWMRVTRVEQGR